MNKTTNMVIALSALGISTAKAANESIEMVVENTTVLEVVDESVVAVVETSIPVAAVGPTLPNVIPSTGLGSEVLIFTMMVALSVLVTKARTKLARY